MPMPKWNVNKEGEGQEILRSKESISNILRNVQEMKSARLDEV